MGFAGQLCYSSRMTAATTAMIEPKPIPHATTEQLLAAINREMSSVRALRHHLHQNPELSFQERQTSATVERELRAAGWQVKSGFAKTGLIAHLPASDPSSPHANACIGLRADMDALPITEATGKPYSSCNPGVMHACGHDGHTSMLVGTAKVLATMHRPRPVTLVFQPAEEGGGGARVMCEEGALAGDGKGGLGTPVTEMFGLHGWPTYEVGHVATRVGPLLAATDDFHVTVRGTQCHAAYPHQGSDSILATSAIITALQSIRSRNAAPQDPIVVSVGAVHGGTANNIIPRDVEFIGTVRTLNNATSAMAKQRFFEIVEGTAAAMGCKAIIDWQPGYPVTSNDARATATFLATAHAAIGPANVQHIEHATMGGEDFAYYGQHVPACFFMLGLRPKGAASYPTLHQPDFDFNDDALPLGIRLFCELALRP